MNSLWSKLTSFWKLQLGGWAVYALIVIPVKWALFGSIVGAAISFYRELIGLVLTFGMYLVYRRIYGHWPVSGILFTVFVLSFAGSAIEIILSLALHNVVIFEEAGFSSDTTRMGVLYYRAAVFAGWSFLYFMLRLISESEDLRRRLAEALVHYRETELQMLRAQMNPHFLFNALNAVGTLAGKSGTKLRALVRSLSDYLRFALDHGADAFVPLGTEYDAMRDYLEVEKFRFSDDLEFECHIDEAARPVAVPGIILQPLVENAIKYGRETSDLPLRVHVKVSRPDASAVHIDVRNTGYWTEPRQREKPSHLGLKNLRRRLELLYADRHRLEIKNDSGWVAVNIHIPTI